MKTIDSKPDSSAEISLSFLRQEVSAAFARVWDTVVGLPIELIEFSAIAEQSFPWLGAVAWIGGSWTGNVRIGMPLPLAELVTARLLELEVPSQEQVLDTLRELANMTAGNLKSALPGRCGLATPGNFNIKTPAELDDEFSPIIGIWCRSADNPLFVGLSALNSE